MAVESATYISQLNTSYPLDGDVIAEGDNHVRLVKSVLQGQFTSLGAAAVTVTAAQINDIVNKAPIASPALTGTPTAPTAAPATSTTQLATTQFVANTLAAAVGSTGVLSLSISNSASVTLVKGQHDASTYAGAVTWTLPASPAPGDTVAVTPLNGRLDGVIARSGSNIMGLAEDMTVDNANTTLTLRYTNAPQGWRLV